MNDFDDDLINDAFAGFSAAATPAVRAAGAGAVRHTVKRRRARNTAALSALGVLLLAVPMAAYASMDRGNQGPPPVGTSPGIAPSLSPSVSPSASPSPESPAGALLGTCAKPLAAQPSGAIPMAELCNATLKLPPWGDVHPNCTESSVRFTNGRFYVRESLDVVINQVVALDVDGDGDLDSVALVKCRGQVSGAQVVAFGRAADGRIHTIGQVVTTNLPIRRIDDITATADGEVVVKVGDFGSGAGENPELAQFQERAYRWDGKRFRQTAGKTSFRLNSNLFDLSVSTTALVFGAAQGGELTGTVTVTVRNSGPAAIAARVYLQVPAYLEVKDAPAGCVPDRALPDLLQLNCATAQLGAGASKKLTFTFIAPADAASRKVTYVPRAAAFGIGSPVDKDHSNNSKDLVLRFG